VSCGNSPPASLGYAPICVRRGVARASGRALALLRSPAAIHHVAYAVPPTEVADLRSSLDERGLTEYLSSQLGEVETTLHDGSAAVGHDIEIHVDSEGLRDFFEMVRGSAAGWDGSEPSRPVES
jgi:hypothetical protein